MTKPWYPPIASTAVLLLTLGLQACDRPTSSSVTFAVRDSAGIVIAENTGSLEPGDGGWSVPDEPTLTIGSFGGNEEEQLVQVAGAVRLSDGGIAIGDAGTQNLRIFAPDGRHRITWGGEGEGPGEFQSVHLAGVLPGDTLVVVDRRLLRVSLFHPEAGFLRSTAMDQGETYLFRCHGMFEGGGVLMEGLGLDEFDSDGYARRSTAFVAVGADGSIVADYGQLPGMESVMATLRTEHGIATTLMSIPFGKEGLGVASGGAFYYASQDAYEIKVFDLQGSLRRIVRVDRPGAPVTPDQVEAFILDQIADVDDENAARETRQRYEEAPVPEAHPAFAALIPGADGYLFVEGPTIPDGPPVLLDVLDPEGRLVGSLPMPAGVDRILEIGPDHLLALHRDEFDVEYVRLYDLVHPAERGRRGNASNVGS